MSSSQRFSVALLTASVLAGGCLDRSVVPITPNVGSVIELPITNTSIEDVDILFVIDNSGSMAQNQRNLANNLERLVRPLIDPPRDPATGRPVRPPVRSLQVGVISSDLGTPGRELNQPGQDRYCSGRAGDDGLLNPIRNGAALSLNPPWRANGRDMRPPACGQDTNAYPTFLRFEASQIDASGDYVRRFEEQFVCNAFLGAGGCGIEQPLEAAYRALVHKGASAPTSASQHPNRGFVRDNAVLAIVIVSDEEDGSTRDCEAAEAGDPDGDCARRGDARSVFTTDLNELNQRFYRYTPGTSEDPTWNLNRYIDPAHPSRGFLGLKPGHPELVVFAAIAGVPLSLPATRDAEGQSAVDWNTLLGTRSNGTDGYVGASPDGPVSMRQNNVDATCSSRVVPACRRREAGASVASGNPACASDPSPQYYAWPSRRIAEVARRFDTRYGNGTISSVCDTDYSEALGQIAERIGQHITDRCLPRPIETDPPSCTADRREGCVTPAQNTPVSVNCVVREILPAGVSAATACTRARGREPGPRNPTTMRDTCRVLQVPVVPGSAPTDNAQGFFYDTRPLEGEGSCTQHIAFTANAGLAPGASATIECLQNVSALAPRD